MVAERSFEAINALVDKYRVSCLWFLDEGFYPETEEQALRALQYIQRYGNRAAYLEAAEARSWLLRPSNETSAAS